MRLMNIQLKEKMNPIELQLPFVFCKINKISYIATTLRGTISYLSQIYIYFISHSLSSQNLLWNCDGIKYLYILQPQLVICLLRCTPKNPNLFFQFFSSSHMLCSSSSSSLSPHFPFPRTLIQLSIRNNLFPNRSSNALSTYI